MKRKYVYFVLGILISVGVVSCFMKPKYSNIFEEIYHDEYYHATHFWGPIPSSLEKLEEIENHKTQGLSFDTIAEVYKKELLPEDIEEIRYRFQYPNDKLKDGKFFISVYYRGKQDNIVKIIYEYTYKSDRLKKYLEVFSKTLKEEYPIQNYLSEYNETAKQYFEIGDYILKTKIISDWLKAYSSQFTLENWGNVEIVTSKEYLE